MKAMLYADWLALRGMGRSLVLIAAVLLATLWSNGPTIYGTMILFLLSMMIANTLCAYDKHHGWERLRMSLPTTRTCLVTARFIFCGMSNAVILTISIVLTALWCWRNAEYALLPNLATLLVCESVAFPMIGASLCIAFRWGVEKARYIWFAFMLSFAAAGALVGQQTELPRAAATALAQLDRLSEMQLLGFAAAACLVGLSGYALCARICMRIFEKAEI